MREEPRFGQLKRQFVLTTDSHHRYQVNPNLLAGVELTALNQAWVGDIPYIRLPSCFVYLACLWMRTHDAVWDGSCPSASIPSWL